MQGEKEWRSRVQLRPMGCYGGQEHVWRGFLSCCKTHSKAYYIQGWSNIGQEPPSDRKLIYPPDMAHLKRFCGQGFQEPFGVRLRLLLWSFPLFRQ